MVSKKLAGTSDLVLLRKIGPFLEARLRCWLDPLPPGGGAGSLVRSPLPKGVDYLGGRLFGVQMIGLFGRPTLGIGKILYVPVNQNDYLVGEPDDKEDPNSLCVPQSADYDLDHGQHVGGPPYHLHESDASVCVSKSSSGALCKDQQLVALCIWETNDDDIHGRPLRPMLMVHHHTCTNKKNTSVAFHHIEEQTITHMWFFLFDKETTRTWKRHHHLALISVFMPSPSRA